MVVWKTVKEKEIVVPMVLPFPIQAIRIPLIHPVIECPENQSWDSTLSKCVECLTDYQKGEGACTSEQKPLCINNTCQPCPNETPVWDTGAGQCVVCLTNTDCSGETTCNISTKTCCPTEAPIWDSKTGQCVDKCFTKSDCPAGHYCSDGDCLACPQRVTIPTYQGCKSTSDNRLCVIGTRIGSTSYKKNTQWVNPYQCTYNVYFSGTLDTKAKSKAHNKVYINGGHALGYDSRKYTYSDSYIGQLAPGGGVEVEIYNNSGRPCSSLSAWMEVAE